MTPPRKTWAGTRPAPKDSSGYLYHKEQDRKRTTWSQPTGGPPRRSPGQDRDRWSLIRAVLITLAGMGLLLMLGLHISKRSWHEKMRHARSRSQPVEPREPPEAASGLTETDDLVTLKPQGAGLDADSIRRAFFLAEQGEQFEREGNHAAAVEQYRQALDAWPLIDGLWARLGHAHLQAGDHTSARQALQRALEQTPDDPAILNDLGVCHLVRRRFDRAFEHFSKAIEANRDYERSYYNLGLCYLGLGDTPHARVALELYLARKPDDARALRELAYLDAADGAYEDALKRLGEAMEADPEWALLYVDAAAASALLARDTDSLAYLQKAEAHSSAAVVAQAIEQPAFKKYRESPAWQAYEREVAQRAAEMKEPKAPGGESLRQPITSADPAE